MRSLFDLPSPIRPATPPSTKSNIWILGLLSMNQHQHCAGLGSGRLTERQYVDKSTKCSKTIDHSAYPLDSDFTAGVALSSLRKTWWGLYIHWWLNVSSSSIVRHIPRSTLKWFLFLKISTLAFIILEPIILKFSPIWMLCHRKRNTARLTSTSFSHQLKVVTN